MPRKVTYKPLVTDLWLGLCLLFGGILCAGVGLILLAYGYRLNRFDAFIGGTILFYWGFISLLLSEWKQPIIDETTQEEGKDIKTEQTKKRSGE